MQTYFTCEEVAQIYKVKTLTVWDWVRRKKLGAIKIGRCSDFPGGYRKV